MDMILSCKRITMALIRLRGGAGWSAPLSLANPEDRFSRVEAQLMVDIILVTMIQSKIRGIQVRMCN